MGLPSGCLRTSVGSKREALPRICPPPSDLVSTANFEINYDGDKSGNMGVTNVSTRPG